jgi:membrane fusion protein, adhesin transport system
MKKDKEFEAIKKAAQISEKIKKKLQEEEFATQDLKFMSSLSEAVLQKSPRKTRYFLWLILIAFAWIILWASRAELDEITRGEGKVIPFHQLQKIQNLEGGIVSEILVHDGDIVKKGQILLKIQNTTSRSSYEEGKLKLQELRAKFFRLQAEANGKNFSYDKKDLKEVKSQLEYEKSLFRTNKEQLNKSLEVLNEQKKQKENELAELEAKINQQAKAVKLIEEEVKITKPLLKKGLVSEVEFLKLSRELNSLSGDLEASTLAVPRIKSQIKEFETKSEAAILDYRNKAKKELNEVVAEISRINETNQALSDRVKRTSVRSPVNGTVQAVLVNTIGGVIQPGMDLVEIVPNQDNLLVEAQVKPSDIAFLRPNLDAMVKFSAYDFSIYGGLKGKLTHISADTITNDKGESYYLVRIKTDKSHLGTEIKPLPIMVGMVASVDIVTGKKTVLDYLLKPILKAKQSALRER